MRVVVTGVSIGLLRLQTPGGHAGMSPPVRIRTSQLARCRWPGSLWLAAWGAAACRHLARALWFRTSARTLTGVLEWAADLRVTGVESLESAEPEGHFEGQMALGGADSGWPGLACASVFPAQGLYQGQDRSVHGKEKVYGSIP